MVADRWFGSSKTHHGCGGYLADLRWTSGSGCVLNASAQAARFAAALQSRSIAVPSLAPMPQEADLALGLAVSSERSTKINGGLLEPLGGDLRSPGEPDHLFSGRPV